MSFPFLASRTPSTSAAHDLDHAAAPLLAHNNRSYHTAAEPSGDNDVEDGRRAYRNARSKLPTYAAPILPFPSPSRAFTVTHSDGDEVPYNSPWSAFSAYQSSDYSSPGDLLDSAYSPYGQQRESSWMTKCWAGLVNAVGAVWATLQAVVTYPVTHPQQTAMALICTALLVSSSGEQVTRKLLASSLYNYRYALFLLLSLVSAMLSTLLTALQWRTIRSYLALSTLPPLLPVLLLVLLSATASLLLLLSTAILPAPLALLFPQLLVPLSLLTTRCWARRPVTRDVALGCGLIVLAIGALSASAVAQADAHSTSDAFIPNRAEICWNILLLVLSTLLSAAVWRVRTALLCAYETHPLVLSSLVGWGQVGAGLLCAPAALWLQYLGTDRWHGVDHASVGGGGLIVGGAGNVNQSSSSTGLDSSSSAYQSYPSSTGSSSSSSYTSSSADYLWSSSTSSTASQLTSSSYVSSSAEASSTGMNPSSSSSAFDADTSSTLLSSITLLSSTASSASSSLVPPSLTSSLASILSLTSSYLSLTHSSPPPSASSHALSPYEHLLLPVIASPDYLPHPSPTNTVSHPPFHASTLLNLEHFTRCLFTGYNSEYGDTCTTPGTAPDLLPLVAAFVVSCLAGQWAMAALAKRSAADGSGSGGGGMASGMLASAAVVAVLCFVSPWPGVSSWLPYHQRVLLDSVVGSGAGWWDGWSLGVCVVLLCVGYWLCHRQEERVVAGVNVWERVEALMREQETVRGSEDSRDRRAAVRRARDHGRR